MFSQKQYKSQKYFYFKHIQWLESSWEMLCTERYSWRFQRKRMFELDGNICKFLRAATVFGCCVFFVSCWRFLGTCLPGCFCLFVFLHWWCFGTSHEVCCPSWMILRIELMRSGGGSSDLKSVLKSVPHFFIWPISIHSWVLRKSFLELYSLDWSSRYALF